MLAPPEWDVAVGAQVHPLDAALVPVGYWQSARGISDGTALALVDELQKGYQSQAGLESVSVKQGGKAVRSWRA